MLPTLQIISDHQLDRRALGPGGPLLGRGLWRRCQWIRPSAQLLGLNFLSEYKGKEGLSCLLCLMIIKFNEMFTKSFLYSANIFPVLWLL